MSSGPSQPTPESAEQHHRYTSLSSLIGPNSKPPTSVPKKKSKPRLRIADDATEHDGQSRSRSRHGERERVPPQRRGNGGGKAKAKEPLGFWRMLSLTVAMGGSQVRLERSFTADADILDRVDSVRRLSHAPDLTLTAQ